MSAREAHRWLMALCIFWLCVSGVGAFVRSPEVIMFAAIMATVHNAGWLVVRALSTHPRDEGEEG